MRHRIPLLLSSALLCYAPLSAQSAAASGSISGTVTDPNGAAIPNATVTLRQTELAQARTLQTDERGEFTAALLAPGAYTVEVKAQGFTAKRPARLTLGVGSSVRVAVQLAVAGSRSEVNVTGRAETSEGNTLPPAVNKTEPETGNTLAGLTVTYLPNRDRDFTSFAQLAAGVEPASANANQVSVAGQRATALNAAVDGAEIRDPLNGGMRGIQDQALFFPQTAVREFTLVRSGATAAVGNTNAGFLNIATKAGSNKLHGEAFYIGRPSAFVSRDAFGH
jgi:hypothetical protein